MIDQSDTYLSKLLRETAKRSDFRPLSKKFN